MKNIALLWLSVVGIFTLNSCETFPTIKPKIVFGKEFSVNNSGATFSGQDMINASESTDFEKYKNKINKVTIEKVTYTVTEVSGNAKTLVAGTIAVANSTGSNKTTLATLSNVNLTNALNVETELSTNSDAIKIVETALTEDPNKMMIYYSGNADTGPIRLRVKLQFYSKVTARLIGSN